MDIIMSDEIRHQICDELTKAQSSVQIISAYCKMGALNNLIGCVKEGVSDKRLMIRFRLDDILKGSTDFNVLSCALEKGWDVYIRFDLHAKTYIFDNKRGIVGSANTTLSGLSFNQNSNLEVAAISDIKSADIVKIESIFKDAIKVDDNLIGKLEEQLNHVARENICARYTWSQEILSMFNPIIQALFSYDLPEKKDVKKGDYIAFLESVYEKDSQVKLLIRDCNAYRWLLQSLRENNGELYFGATSSMLHNMLVSDPKPYRKDVKEMLSNLLWFVERFKMDEVVIDRPNYSQRIRLQI